jgi:hypothetical protein
MGAATRLPSPDRSPLQQQQQAALPSGSTWKRCLFDCTRPVASASSWSWPLDSLYTDFASLCRAFRLSPPRLPAPAAALYSLRLAHGKHLLHLSPAPITCPVAMATNPPQLFLLADHIKLSLLERQRAISLNLSSNSQDAQISRSLDQLRSGIESLESQVQDTADEYASQSMHTPARRLLSSDRSHHNSHA